MTITFRVESTSRWDALALAHKLPRYNWYLIEPDPRHWNVCIPVEHARGVVPDDVRRTIKAWLRERGLKKAIVHQGEDDFVITD